MKFDLSQIAENGLLDLINHTAFQPRGVTAQYDAETNALEFVPKLKDETGVIPMLNPSAVNFPAAASGALLLEQILSKTKAGS